MKFGLHKVLSDQTREAEIKKTLTTPFRFPNLPFLIMKNFTGNVVCYVIYSISNGSRLYTKLSHLDSLRKKLRLEQICTVENTWLEALIMSKRNV